MSKPGIFTSPEGKSYAFTFALVSSLFFLWALCNGMIDVMDKHFQDYLKLTKSESAWVQFAHYVGYFLMAMPAGWLAKKLGYKAGIIAGLALVAAGCLWFIPATAISEFWAFLVGVCAIAMGLTFLETIANPYTTVLGPQQYAATRINLAQSCNGIGWIAGPIVGGMFFYSGNLEESHKSLWIPYAGIAVAVVILIIIFAIVKLPDVAGPDACHVDAKNETPDQLASEDRAVNRPLSFSFLVLNAMGLVGTLGAIGGIILQILGEKTVKDAAGVETTHITATGEWLVAKAAAIAGQTVTIGYAPWVFMAAISVALMIVAALLLIPVTKRLHNRSIWTHPHFSASTITQFLYVAAQAGIFSFFINYIVSEVPAVGEGAKSSWLLGGEKGVHLRDGAWFISEQGASKLLALGFVLFLLGRFTGSAILRKFSAAKLLGLYAVANAVLCAVVMAKLGWISVVAVFLTFFFMSIMFPTIFALGIFGLGSKAKTASSFIVMGITGGALMPKVMGWMGDHYGMSASFLVPLLCFILIAAYGFCWSKLSGVASAGVIDATKGH